MSARETMTRAEAAREMMTNPADTETELREDEIDVWVEALRDEAVNSSDEYEWEPF